MKMFKNYLPVFLYLLLGIPLMIIFQHEFYSNDTFQYLSIARKYAEGNFSVAINGFIGPLIPWLLVPFLKLKIDPILSVKILEFLLGVVALIILPSITRKIISNKWLRIVLNFSFVPIILSYAIIYVSADLLFLILLLLYINLLLGDVCLKNNRTVWQIGIVAGLLYLTKSFGCYFFITHFIIVMILNWKYGNQDSFSWRPVIKTLFIFLSICMVWITILTASYGRFTLTTSGDYLFKALGPEYFPDDKQLIHHPPHVEGLFPPPNADAVSVWEEPNAIPMKSWSPFNSGDEFRHYMKVIGRNISSIWYHDFQRQAGFILLVLFILFIFLCEERFHAVPKKFYFFLFTYLLLAGSISLIYFLPRYAWLNPILLIFMIVILAEELVKRNIFKSAITFIFVGIAIVLITKRSVKEILFLEDKEITADEAFSAVRHPILTMKNNLLRFDNHYALIEKLQQIPELKGNVASFQDKDLYHYVAEISYYLHLHYYGELTNGNVEMNIFPNELPSHYFAKSLNRHNQFLKFGIEYYFVENSSTANESILDGKIPVYKDLLTGLKIYKVNGD